MQTDTGGFAYRVVTLTNGVLTLFDSDMSGDEILENGAINFTAIRIKDQKMGPDGEPDDTKNAEYNLSELMAT